MKASKPIDGGHRPGMAVLGMVATENTGVMGSSVFAGTATTYR